MKKIVSFLYVIFFLATIVNAQAPHLAGTVDLSIKGGSFTCSFLLTNISLKKYRILLNSGFNIKSFRDSADNNNYVYEKRYDNKVSYEAFQYVLPESDTTYRYPGALRINYTGSFPVVTDTARMYSRGDWKGNIAFNGTTLRAADQTAWYPQLYDMETELTTDQFTYDIKVTCTDGAVVYVNGDQPKKGSINTFHSLQPVSLLLFAGNFAYVNTGGLNYLNTTLSLPAQQSLSKWTNGIIDFYQQQLKIPYGKKINYIATTATTKDNAWLFVTYPSVVVVGNKSWGIQKLFSSNKPLTIDTFNIQYISHELGHFYFGTSFKPNSLLYWMFLEGFTEYLSLQYTRHSLGEKVYRQTLNDYVKTVRSFGSIIPISRIARPAQVGEGYRYYYIPLLLTALEKELGTQRTWEWLSGILKDRNVTTNYAYFKATLLRAGMTDTAFAAFESGYINNENAVEKVIAAALK